MSLLVKICGINSVAAADAAVRAGADFAGLVFHPASPRQVTLDFGRSLADRMRGHLRLVTLFADAADDAIGAVVTAIRPDFVQLHGGETADRVGQLRAKFKVRVIKAVAIADENDLEKVPALEQASDMLLFDARPPDGAERTGGNGAAFDWKILRGRIIARPWFLAGGLNEDNLARAVAQSGAKAVDVSSGVESAPGVKDTQRIAAFLSGARNLGTMKANP
jgi:phosphoribosylanthranilate isomerase